MISICVIDSKTILPLAEPGAGMGKLFDWWARFATGITIFDKYESSI